MQKKENKMIQKTSVFPVQKGTYRHYYQNLARNTMYKSGNTDLQKIYLGSITRHLTKKVITKGLNNYTKDSQKAWHKK